jgi:cyclin-dependent kinase 2
MVAIKHIKNIEEGEGLPTTTMREISILKNLEHRHIVKLLNVTLDPSDNCILNARLIFEFANEDLAKFLNRSQPLAETTIKVLLIVFRAS